MKNVQQNVAEEENPFAQTKTEILRNQDWCNKSLDQLDMSAALLSQCLDSDLNDLKRQNAVLNQCLQEINAMKQNQNY